jgi:hypothetical protein
MEAETDYWLIWLVYLGGSGIFYPIFWRYTAFRRARWLSYSLRALMAALILTPWYANTQGETLAPALMVATLDAITIGSEAAIRAGVPLVMALFFAEILATILWFAHRRKKTHQRLSIG